jgi:uncharacterized OB-fold protein
MMAAQRPLPRLDSDNRAFWTGGAEGKLRISHCRDCDSWQHPPGPVCRQCLSENISPEAVPGTGLVDTYTVNHQAWAPGQEVPFVIARVTLDGAPGVILTTNIVGSPPESVDIGDRVRVVFEQHEDVWIPLFEKVA